MRNEESSDENPYEVRVYVKALRRRSRTKRKNNKQCSQAIRLKA